MIRDLAGTGALAGQLEETNRLLALVLEELKETNAGRLGLVGEELRQVNTRLDELTGLVRERPVG